MAKETYGYTAPQYYYWSNLEGGGKRISNDAKNYVMNQYDDGYGKYWDHPKRKVYSYNEDGSIMDWDWEYILDANVQNPTVSGNGANLTGTSKADDISNDGANANINAGKDTIVNDGNNTNTIYRHKAGDLLKILQTNGKEGGTFKSSKFSGGDLTLTINSGGTVIFDGVSKDDKFNINGTTYKISGSKLVK